MGQAAWGVENSLCAEHSTRRTLERGFFLGVLLHFTDGSVRSQKGSVSLLVRAEPGLEVRPPDPKSRALSLTLLSLAVSQHFHCPWPLRPLSPS